jgi:O-antigen ligase
MLGILFGYYVFLGVTIRPQVIPGFGPQAVVWVIYAVLFALLYIRLRKAGLQAIGPGLSPQRFSWLVFLEVSLALTLTSAGLNFIPGNYISVIRLFFWVFGTVGLGLFLYAAWDTLRPAQA